MRVRVITIGILLGLCGVTFVRPTPAVAEEPLWPSDMEQQLADVGERVLEVQRKRAVARLHGREEESKKLDKEFDELQKEHLQLLRDLGQID